MQIATIFAGVFCLVCWAFTAWELQANADVSIPIANHDTKTVATSPLDSLAMAEHSGFVAFVKQPLFRPDRQPLDWAQINRSNAADQQKSLTDIEQRYQLQGVSISKPDQAALIFDRENSETLTLNLNESLSGWTLQLVDKHSVTFARQADKLQLFLSPTEISPKITTRNELTVQHPKPLKAYTRAPEDDPYH